MIEHIYTLLPFAVALIWGVYGLIQVNEKISDLLDKLPIYGDNMWMYKPLTDCPPCMSSVWGAVVWFGFNGISWPAVLWFVPFAFSLLGCNYLLTKFVK